MGPKRAPCLSRAVLPSSRGERQRRMTDVSLQRSGTNCQGARPVAAQRGQHTPLLPGRVSGPLLSSCMCLALLFSREPITWKPPSDIFAAVTLRKTAGANTWLLWRGAAAFPELLFAWRGLGEAQKSLPIACSYLSFLLKFSHVFVWRSLPTAHTPSQLLKKCEGEGGGQKELQSREKSILSRLTASGETQYQECWRRQAARCTTSGDDWCFGGISILGFGRANWLRTCSANLFLWLTGLQLDCISQPLLQLHVVTRLSSEWQTVG